jgi:hypothetical protein
MLDESRHVAFGVLSLKGAYEDMTASELARARGVHPRRVEPHARSLPDAGGLGEHGMPVAECVDAVHKSPIMQTFQSLLFSKIVPNVKKLGLLTPRVRKGFEELRVIQYETWDASA